MNNMYCEHCPARGHCGVCGSSNVSNFDDLARDAERNALVAELANQMSPTGAHVIPSVKVPKVIAEAERFGAVVLEHGVWRGPEREWTDAVVAAVAEFLTA